MNIHGSGFGIGNNFRKAAQIDYVLGTWSPDEKKFMEERIQSLLK